MDLKISSDELGESRCSDFELPLLTSETLGEIVLPYLRDIANKQWELLRDGDTDSMTVILLSNMCLEMVETVSNMVLDDVAPTVYNMSIHKPVDSSVTMDGIEAPQREPNYGAVTEEDIQASLGHSLHQCLGEAFGVMEEMSEDSEQLLQLVAEEVAKKVNRTLAFIRQSTSSNQSVSFECETTESPTPDMVYHVIKILQRCLVKKFHPEFPDKGARAQDLSLALSPDDKDIEEISMEADKDSPSEWQSSDLTKTSVLELDFDGILKNPKKSMGETRFTLPQTVGKLHLTIFKKLCAFGSAKLLQTATVSEGLVFEEAVAMELKRQLQKATRPSFATKVRRLFKRRSNKVSPACRVVTSVSHSNVIQQENGSTTLLQRKHKRPAIIRMFFCCGQRS